MKVVLRRTVVGEVDCDGLGMCALFPYTIDKFHSYYQPNDPLPDEAIIALIGYIPRDFVCQDDSIHTKRFPYAFINGEQVIQIHKRSNLKYLDSSFKETTCKPKQ